MIRYILPNYLQIALQSIVKNYLYSRVIPVRWRRFFLIPFSLIISVLWAINNYAFPSGSAVMDIVVICCCLFGPLLFTEKSDCLKGFILTTVFFGIEVMAMYAVAMVAFPIAERLCIPPEELVNKTTSYGNAIMALICTPFILGPDYLAARLLKKLYGNRQLSLWILCFIPIPISQGVIVNLLNRVLPYSGGIRGLNAAFLVGMVASAAADIGFFIGVRQVLRAERLKEQVRVAEEQLAIQTGYYQQLQDNILAINQIRHDLNNQLQAAYCLLEQGEHSQVRAQLDQIQSNVRDRVGPRFCANLMVDAVLSEKSRLCREQGIRFSVDAQLPPELPIKSARLCSAFSNLLDNSIHGAQETPSGEKWIALRAALHAEYIIIRCVNSAGTPAGKQAQKNPLRQHGLGLDILKQIAAHYQGSFEAEQHGGRFEATLILQFPGEAPDQ